jgi:hypothetical protein
MDETNVTPSGPWLRRPRSSKLLVLGGCSLLFFWAPLVAPLIQVWTFVEAGLALRRRAARSGAAERRNAGHGPAVFALVASLAGFALFLAAEFLWVA